MTELILSPHARLVRTLIPFSDAQSIERDAVSVHPPEIVPLADAQIFDAANCIIHLPEGLSDATAGLDVEIEWLNF